MADIPALEFTTHVNEDSSCKLTFYLKNYAGTALGVAAISTATLTLIDQKTGDYMVTGGSSPEDINELDVKTGLDANGLMTWYLEGESNTIVGDAETKTEVHLAIFKFTGTYSGQTVKLTQAIKIYVNNVEGI